MVVSEQTPQLKLASQNQQDELDKGGDNASQQHSVRFLVSPVNKESIHPVLSSIMKDLPGECVEYRLADYRGSLGRCEVMRHNHALYIAMSSLTDSATKECFLAMIEHSESTKSAQSLVACVDRTLSERSSLVRTLMFMGFKATTFVRLPRLIPKNNKLIFMIYRIYEPDEILIEID